MIRVIELFSGIGSQTQALKNIGVEHKVIAISEIDKYAEKSYRALHNKEVLNLGDISKIDSLPEADLWTYSSPCTDISVAGKQAGCGKGSGTRSGLLWEVERLLLRAKESRTLPRYLLLENVKNLIGKKHRADYEKWLDFLFSLGYKNYWQVLNAKHYGIPQNRERVFCVSILNNESTYEFPKPFPLKLRLRDLLETEVPEKFYITREKVISLLSSHYNQRRTSIINKDVTPALCARDWKEPKCVVLGNLTGDIWDKMHESSRRVYSDCSIAPTINTCGGGNLSLYKDNFYYPDRRNTKMSKKPKKIYTNKPNHQSSGGSVGITETSGYGNREPKVMIGAMRGRNPDNPSSRTAGLKTKQRLEINTKELCNALTTIQKDNLVVCEERKDEGIRLFKDNCCGALRTIDSCGDKRVLIDSIDNGIRVRKLVPKECWRLMGWNDNEIDKVIAIGISNSQMYRQAGNGICIQVLEKIFNELFVKQ